MTDQTAAAFNEIMFRLARIENQTRPKLPWLVALAVALALNAFAVPYLKSTDNPYIQPIMQWAMDKERQGIAWLVQQMPKPYAPTDTSVSQPEGQNVHPDLLAVFNRAQQLAKAEDFVISIRDGARTHQEQAHYVKTGASKTYNSRHLIAPNGWAHALDLEVKYPGKQTNKKDWHWVRRINKVMQQASKELGIPVNWGGNWKTFKDGFHHELPWKTYAGKTRRSFLKTTLTRASLKQSRTITAAQATQGYSSTTKQKATCLPKLTAANQQRLLTEIKRTESSGGNYQAVNPDNGSLGAYQTKASTLSNANIGLIKAATFNGASQAVREGLGLAHKTFLNNPDNWTLKGGKKAFLGSRELQDKVALKTLENHFKWGKNYGAINCSDPQKKLAGYAKASWFGWKNAARWYRDGIDFEDGNEYKVSEYAREGEGIAVEQPMQEKITGVIKQWTM